MLLFSTVVQRCANDDVQNGFRAFRLILGIRVMARGYHHQW
jgi:hypothetical protein